MRSLSDSVGDDGVPGLRSTKKLPSRKMRGRIFSVASLWMGSALLSSSMVTTAASLDPARSTFLTLPTLTPAMRTGDPGRRLLDDSNTAWSRYPCVNGMCLVKPKYVMAMSTTARIAPAVTGAIPVRDLRDVFLAI